MQEKPSEAILQLQLKSQIYLNLAYLKISKEKNFILCLWTQDRSDYVMADRQKSTSTCVNPGYIYNRIRF